MIAVRQILGLGGIPKDRTSATKWLQRNAVAIRTGQGNGGEFECIALSDLPTPERLAYLERSIATLGLPLGTYDDAAHEVFMRAPVSMRERAERNASMVRLLVALGQRVGWSERLSLLQRQFGPDCPSKGTLKRYLKAAKGVGPINYAPALLPKYKGKVATAEISD